jgi:hypothetical protein
MIRVEYFLKKMAERDAALVARRITPRTTGGAQTITAISIT